MRRHTFRIIRETGYGRRNVLASGIETRDEAVESMEDYARDEAFDHANMDAWHRYRRANGIAFRIEKEAPEELEDA